ncbi:MAG: hypothetical protein DCC59_04050 [Chloroflexi bacterium]|nr:hypothetical protein [Chloroflexi bacterium CFX1]MCK6567830.1 hypothetical protein [Anaerolineales bacterium]MCQ3954738.1 hypothetical protein [Chloroflexota bacterium]MDL1918448.1 hypothetical protein [Chloroflexi bacterium CFX5]NUQ59509.1 hypothetical protein [Anaerolineales bacterium]
MTDSAAHSFESLTSGHCRPQAAALAFDSTGEFRALDSYFPITRMLDKAGIDSFYQLVQRVARHPCFDLRLIGANKTNLTPHMPASARHLVAGHLAEVFFFRQDILARFLSRPRHFQLYVTPEAYRQDGGISGGCYSPSREAIQLLLSRLFEGFNSPTPGVCPFLHELGHMLDHFDARTGKMGKAKGLYPGLSPGDGDLFTPKAREFFLKGKRLELTRYLSRLRGDLSQPMPIGHPYVFQNDGEFAAGYLEMFFRNPHYFAQQNADLFAAYVELFGCDTRRAWTQDFPHYVNANRSFYASGKKPPKTRLTLPKE